VIRPTQGWRLGPTLDPLLAAYRSWGYHQFDSAYIEIGTIPIPIQVQDITVEDIQEAFATDDLKYVIISPKFPGEGVQTGEGVQKPTGGGVKRETHTLKGYPGPLLDAQELVAAHQLVKGGPERDFHLGLLKAEINFGKRNFSEAITLYDAALTATPSGSLRHKFVAIRSAFARLALGDQLFRKQRTLSDQDRQNITGIYDAAVRLLQEKGVSPDNPRRQEVETYVNQQKAKLQSRLNYLGLWDAFVPVQRYSQLEQDAKFQIDAARDSAKGYQDFLSLAEQEIEKQMDVQSQQDQENGNLRILNFRQGNATLSIGKIDEQLSAIDDQRHALDLTTLAGGLRAIMEGVVTGIQKENGPLGIASGGVGLVGAAINFSAQDNELAHQRRMAEIEREIAANQVDIANLERDLSKHRIEFYAQKRAFLGSKRLNADFLYTLAELNRKRAERQLEGAIFLAYLFERALAFFLGEPNIRHIQFDYLDRPGGILDAYKALIDDFQHVLEERNKVNELKFDSFGQDISLRESYPIQFSRFLQTGKMDFDYSLYQLSKLHPSSHQCRLREVGVEIKGLIPATGFSGTLTHRGRFLVRDKTATLSDPGATRLVPTDAQLARALEEQRRQGLPVAAVGGVLFYDLDADTKELGMDTQFVSKNPPDQNQVTLNIFEGHGPTGLWHLEIRDHGRLNITDILLHFAIVSRLSDVDVLQPKVEDLIRKYESELAGGDSLDRISVFSLRQNFPDTFFALQTGPASLSLGQENFPSGLTHLQFKLVIAQALDQGGKAVPGVKLEIHRQEFGFNQVRVTRTDGFSEDLDAPPQTLPRDHRFPVVGAWQIRLSNPAQFAQLGDLRLFFMYAFEEL
jgi:hypothetical protein